MQQPALQPPVVAINEAGHKAYHGNTVAGINEAGHKAYHGSTGAGLNAAGPKAYDGRTTPAAHAAARLPAARGCTCRRPSWPANQVGPHVLQ